jgi:tetratricopeptide (TPR) repeat protein
MALRLNNFTLLFVFQFICSCFVAGQVYERPPAFAKKVYDDLYRSMDNNKTVQPKLVIENNLKQVAAYNPKGSESGGPVIILGSDFIRLARNFGKDSMNALAHVLGHELAHVFLNQNDLISSIGSGYASKELNDQLKKQKKTLQDSVFERQADEHAAFYCHVAGYKTTHIGESVLDSIYRRFNLTNKMLSRYPPLEERKEIVRVSQKKMEALRMMFDDGVLALIAGNYDMSRALFNAIIKEGFNSREMYNNLGLSLLMSAIEELDTLDYPYVFPVQIEMKSSLDAVTERSLSLDTKDKLEEALKIFKLASGTSDDYHICYINSAIAELLLEDYSAMEVSLQKASKSLETSVLEAIVILRVIQLHRTDQEKKAIQELKKLADKSQLARINYIKITGEAKPSSVQDFKDPVKQIIEGTIPNHNFSTDQAKQGKVFISTLSSRNDFSLRVGVDEFYNSKRWGYLYGSPQPRMDLYSKKEISQVSEMDWKDLVAGADRYYTSSGIEYVKFKSFVFKRVNDEVFVFIIK